MNAPFASVVFILAPLLGLAAAARAAEWPADDPHVSYEGRYALGAHHEARLGFPGITIRLRTTATTLRMKVRASSDDVFFNVSVDGQPSRRVRVPRGDSELTLLDGATAGVHEIEVVRATESWQGVCDIEGFAAPAGALLAPPPLPSRRLMFIGDSITCGEGVIPNAPGLTAAERTDASQSYGMRLARRLHAQCDLVAYGGRGVIRDWQGIRATNNAPQFYELALPDDPKSWWDPKRYVPDAIGICLGTNDFSQGIPDENEFVNGYVEFIRKIQRDAPHAIIFVIDSPILVDAETPKRTACNGYLDEVVRLVDSPNVRRAHVRHYPGSEGDAHPIGSEHALIANELEPLFRAALHW